MYYVMGGLRFWGRPMAAIVPCHCLLEGLKIREDGTTRAGYYDGACIPPPRRVFACGHGDGMPFGLSMIFNGGDGDSAQMGAQLVGTSIR